MKEIAKKWKLPAIMLGPFLILIVLFFFLPVILTGILAFTKMDSSMQWEFSGLLNFYKLFADPAVMKILRNTFFYVFFTLMINVFFSLTLAIITSYFIKSERYGLICRTIWMLPRMTPPVIYALLWIWFFDPSEYGLLNGIRSLFDLPPINLIGTQPMLIIILANGLIGASFGMIIFSSAIKSIPQDLFYAANVDGASHWSIIKDIIMPAIRWPFMFVTMWQLLSLLTSCEYILLITNGGPLNESEVLALYSYHKAFQNFEFGYGAAISLILVVIAPICTFILWRLFRVKDMMGISQGSNKEAGLMETAGKSIQAVTGQTFLLKLKRRMPYIISYGVLAITTLPVILMYLWLIIQSFAGNMKYGLIPQNLSLENWEFLWQNVFYKGAELPSIWTATWNSLLFAGTLTLLEVLIGIMAGYALSRLSFPGREQILKLTMILHAFPSIALLIATFYILNFMGLYDSLFGVVLVKTALQLPMTTWIIKGFFDDVPWDLEWAGLIDGCSRLKEWAKIVLPQVKPGIASVSIFHFYPVGRNFCSCIHLSSAVKMLHWRHICNY